MLTVTVIVLVKQYRILQMSDTPEEWLKIAKNFEEK